MKIGFGKVDITPPLGIPLCGQLVALNSTRVESSLFATAMCIDNGLKKLVFVSCDVLLISNELAKEIVAESMIEEVVVAATHTHSGPATIEVFGDNVNEQYLAQLKDGILESIRNAIHNLEEGILRFSRDTLDGLAFNRRFLMDNDTVETHPLKANPHIVRPEGADSNDINIVWAETNQGRILGGLVVFGCHPTVMERDSTLISAEFPGKAVEYLEQKFMAPFLYMQGACGDICQVNPMDYSQRETGGDWIKKMGYDIARKTEKMINSKGSILDTGLNIITQVIKLPRRKISSELLNWANKHKNTNAIPPLLSDYGSEIYNQLPPEKVSLEDLFKTPFWADFYANEIKTRQYDYLRQPKMPFTIKIITIGKLAIIFLPCELFIEWQNKIIEASPFENTIVIELANGWNGYIPTQEAFVRSGGYETKEVTSTMLVPEAGDIVYKAIKKMLLLL